MKKSISTLNAPAAIGPYSQCIYAGGMYFLSGMLGIDPDTGAFAGDTAAEQTEQACKNIDALLDQAGLTMEHIVKTTIYLTDLKQFADVNEVYGSFFTQDPPARSCVEVSRLPKNALVEIECIAVEESHFIADRK
jgi:2-iminobutanoate/2-iminopropanoate deaminase